MINRLLSHVCAQLAHSPPESVNIHLPSVPDWCEARVCLRLTGFNEEKSSALITVNCKGKAFVNKQVKACGHCTDSVSYHWHLQAFRDWCLACSWPLWSERFSRDITYYQCGEIRWRQLRLRCQHHRTTRRYLSKCTSLRWKYDLCVSSFDVSLVTQIELTSHWFMCLSYSTVTQHFCNIYSRVCLSMLICYCAFSESVGN